ncbi:hypothetical protein DES53_12253 [Roseimicrobium gellanilyticum]|uniref:Uncharacterized protein n=1 Tax=Roseimicrobium gellanilyticum TaxID=748857 RepID=A0A366H3L0_9BACT|nr:hypothetical protein [Roseimicrobium gellanilyticum]RBP35386.1 hypothetical protein DES53_12253 [Roseimicrobium gellanilyticum]
MKSLVLFAFGLLAFAHAASGIDIAIEPLPPVGSEISKSEDGVVQVHMDKPGTVILGRCQVEALPENYIIIFTAEGMATELGGGSIALVIYTLDQKDIGHRAHGGSNMGRQSAEWSHLKTSYLAKATKQHDQIILGMHCEAPCKIQLRNFKVNVMTRQAYEEKMDARFKKMKESEQRKAKSDQ